MLLEVFEVFGIEIEKIWFNDNHGPLKEGRAERGAAAPQCPTGTPLTKKIVKIQQTL